jgi:hypothetical protein
VQVRPGPAAALGAAATTVGCHLGGLVVADGGGRRFLDGLARRGLGACLLVRVSFRHLASFDVVSCDLYRHRVGPVYGTGGELLDDTMPGHPPKSR